MTDETKTPLGGAANQGVLAPFHRYLRALTTYMDSIGHIQLDTAKAGVRISSNQFRAALGVREAEGWQAYWRNQGEVTREVAEHAKHYAAKLEQAQHELVRNCCQLEDQSPPVTDDDGRQHNERAKSDS